MEYSYFFFKGYQKSVLTDSHFFLFALLIDIRPWCLVSVPVLPPGTSLKV